MNVRCRSMAAMAVLVGLCWSSVQGAETLKGRVVRDPAITPLFDTNSMVYHAPRCAARPVIDGQADEWQTVPAMVLDRKEQSIGKWSSPADLSASLRIQWDDAGLYFCLQVVDDVHRAPFARSRWWEDDSCQFAFDPYMNGPRKGYDCDELSYILFDSPQGLTMGAYRVAGMLGNTDLVLKDVPSTMGVQPEGTRVYEWMLTWTQLQPVSPWVLGRCGFSWTVNDNDERNFKSALCWGAGIVRGQDASRFGQLVLDGAPGTQPAFLGLRPESKGANAPALGRWLPTLGVDPFATARMIVRTPQPATVSAKVAVYRAGADTPVARGALTCDLAANQKAVLAWDLSGLPNGRYEIVYEAPALYPRSTPRLGFVLLGAIPPRDRMQALYARCGLERPWDAMADAPALIGRHRGLVAVAREVFDSDTWTRATKDVDTLDEHAYLLGFLSDMAVALEAGKDFLATQRGTFWSAYHSQADGSGQLFQLCLPPDFKASRTYPLVVNLHGAGKVPVPQPMPPEVAASFIEVYPWGRGASSGYRALGENDVLEVIRYLERWYKIDRTRVYLTGGSMGGGGTWRLASRYPDCFAAAAPICGESSSATLENLRNVPVLNQHGLQDWILSIDRSRYGVSRLQQMGYPVIHNEVPYGEHRLTPLYPLRDWMLTHSLPMKPAAVTLACQTPEEGRAYWVRVIDVVDPHVLTRVQACVDGFGPHQSLTLGLDNVAILELDLTRMPVESRTDLLIQAGLNLLHVKAPLPPVLRLALSEGRWAVAETVETPIPAVHPYRPGAAASLYDAGEPLMIVYGARGSEERVKLLRDAGAKLADWAGSSDEPMPLGRFQIKADRDVTADDLNRYNIILLGNVRDSELASRIVPGFPLQLSAQNDLTAGSRTPLSLAGAGLRLFFYNPLAPRRVIFWIAPGENAEDTAKWLKEPRWLVTGASGEDRIYQADLIVQSMNDGVVRRCMQFTSGWQWRNVTGNDEAARPVPAAMTENRAFQQALLRVFRKAAPCDYALEWAPAEAQRLYDPQSFTEADLVAVTQPEQVVCGSVTGQELIEIQEMFIAKGKLQSLPLVDVSAIDTNRLYRLAMPVSVPTLLKAREKNLRHVEAGPDIPARTVVAEVMGE